MAEEFPFLPADPAFRAACELLHRELVEANSRVNLTRILERRDFYVKHVADSLLLVQTFPRLREKPLRVADIGCGAGFPSLVLALACPNWQLTAIDSTGKKTAFVQRMKELLRLDNLTVVTGRSRELDRRSEFRHAFDLVTARAVAAAPVIVADSRNFPRPGGGYILYKTPEQAAADLIELRKHAAGNWRVTPVLELPEGAGARQFLYNYPEPER